MNVSMGILDLIPNPKKHGGSLPVNFINKSKVTFFSSILLVGIMTLKWWILELETECPPKISTGFKPYTAQPC
jgi:hypothetical protein